MLQLAWSDWLQYFGLDDYLAPKNLLCRSRFGRFPKSAQNLAGRFFRSATYIGARPSLCFASTTSWVSSATSRCTGGSAPGNSGKRLLRLDALAVSNRLKAILSSPSFIGTLVRPTFFVWSIIIDTHITPDPLQNPKMKSAGDPIASSLACATPPYNATVPRSFTHTTPPSKRTDPRGGSDAGGRHPPVVPHGANRSHREV
jgi:hypothetical protein